MFAYCTIEEQSDGKIRFIASDVNENAEYSSDYLLPLDGNVDMHKCVYNALVNTFNIEPLSFILTTFSDSAPGSGLGSCSALVVAMLKAFLELLKLPMDDYEISRLAYKVGRVDLKISGGKKDQYAAAFGGFNYMEFFGNDHAIINTLRIKRCIIDELEASMLLYYTGVSRLSAMIIDEQIANITSDNITTMNAMHSIRQSSIDMKESLLKGDIVRVADILRKTWISQKQTASIICNKNIEHVFEIAISAGAYAGKVSGAGGGGFIMFMIHPTRRIEIVRELSTIPGGRVIPFQFNEGGSQSWKVNV